LRNLSYATGYLFAVRTEERLQFADKDRKKLSDLALLTFDNVFSFYYFASICHLFKNVTKTNKKSREFKSPKIVWRPPGLTGKLSNTTLARLPSWI